MCLKNTIFYILTVLFHLYHFIEHGRFLSGCPRVNLLQTLLHKISAVIVLFHVIISPNRKSVP